MADDDRTDDPEAGAPIGKDALDPELISLRRAAPRIGALAAAAVVILCAVLMVRLRHDLAFARAGATPKQVTIDDIVAGHIAADSYVTLTAPPDSASALRAQVSVANPGTRVRPVAGTDDRLWLAEPGDAWGPARHDEVVSGRLRSMSEVRFGGPVARALAKGAWPRFVTGAELSRARQASAAGGALHLVDGGTISVKADTDVELWLPDPGQAIVVGTFGSHYPDVAAWTDALAKAGVIAAGTAPTSKTEALVRWQVQRPDAVASIGQQLDAAQLWGARVEPSPVRVRVKWSELVATPDGVDVPSHAGAAIPWSAIDVAGIWAPRTMPSGARVILTDEKPADYWYLTWVYIGLAVIGVLFTWALVMAIRRQFFDATTVRASAAGA
ncbi:MAG TPA: hypothetical protein VHE35_05520 [Kofleriaceae bacterium]|nr:hypothetical protein [Kofleriaceae bacterium]